MGPSSSSSSSSSSSRLVWVFAVVVVVIGYQITVVSSVNCTNPSDPDSEQPTTCKYGRNSQCCSGSCETVSKTQARCKCGRTKYNALQYCAEAKDCCYTKCLNYGYCDCASGGNSCEYGRECCTGYCKNKMCTSCKAANDGPCTVDAHCCGTLHCDKASNICLKN